MHRNDKKCPSLCRFHQFSAYFISFLQMDEDGFLIFFLVNSSVFSKYSQNITMKLQEKLATLLINLVVPEIPMAFSEILRNIGIFAVNLESLQTFVTLKMSVHFLEFPTENCIAFLRPVQPVSFLCKTPLSILSALFKVCST